ncbi:hypothetical protein G7075_02230 [Phycicoccus sp. HDW14]|uniref:hypothetical protein n=1 Tax=Phycicoccus sp. HDW14 TaxID=2714941 RepID=UPI0014087773|nr:hypothetical protein [Phycicoccus sp. HDW14]QIM20243.1 hypothetical protein G7075_02230 [Phycicoccus sp. HDW14]
MVAPLLLLALAVLWWLELRRGEPTPVTSFAVDGSRVDVTYTGSDCQDGSRLEVTEEATRVVLTVRAWEFPTGCNDMGVTYRVSATLDEPLGTREVVDGACFDDRVGGYPACSAP